MKQHYGSTPLKNSFNDDEERRSLQMPGSKCLNPLTTPSPNRSSLPRNESAGGATIQTNESEPLLGEQLLMGNDDNDHSGDDDDEDYVADVRVQSDSSGFANKRKERGGQTNNHSKFPIIGIDASPIDKEESDDAFPLDPHIGINVVTNNDMDTLSYSRDLDDSTLFTNDRYFRSNGSAKKHPSAYSILEGDEGDEHGRKQKHGGILRILFGEIESDRPPYFLVCFGLAVGIALCAIAALGYVEYWHHYGVDVVPGGSTTSSGGTISKTTSEGTWQGVPFTKVSRESFGDPVSNILDVTLFHPSLLYQKSSQDTSGSTTTTLLDTTNDNDSSGGDDKNERRLASTTISSSTITSTAQPFLKVPFPTGSFWTNLVMLPVSTEKQQGRKLQSNPQSSASKANSNQYSYPIVAYPYAFQWSPLGKLQASYSASRRTIKSNSIQDAFLPDLTMGSVEDIDKRHVVKFDCLSVTLRFSSNGEDGNKSSGGYWESYIVQGSPYITTKYSGLTPELTALSDFADISCPPMMMQQTLDQSGHSRRTKVSASATDGTSKMLGICDVSDSSTQHNKVISGVQFVVTTKEQLTWLVFVSEPISFQFNQGARRSIQSTGEFDGIIRVALVPPPPTATTSLDNAVSTQSLDLEHLASSPGVKRLIYHAGAYAVGGSVAWDFRSGTRVPLASLASSPSSGHRRVLDTNERNRVRGNGQEQTKQRRTASKSTNNENNIGIVTFEFEVMVRLLLQSI